MENKGKLIAIISYITLIGWIVAIILYSNEEEKSPLARFHLKQSFGIFILAIAAWLAIMILAAIFVFIIPVFAIAIGFLSYVIWISLLILVILGIINAANEEEKPLPLIGKFANEKLTFIK